MNFAFMVFNLIDPFDANLPIAVASDLINSTGSAANISSSSALGAVWGAVGSLDLIINIVLGPLTLVPQLLKLIGVTGLINTGISAMVWFVYTVFLFQLVSKIVLKDVW